MQDVLRMSCDRPEGGAQDGAGRRTRPPAWLFNAVAAVFATALGLHLVAELVALVDPRDPYDLLTAAGGMAAVLITIAPFAVAFAERAHRAWNGRAWRGEAKAAGPRQAGSVPL